MKLLVSPINVDESIQALEGGADIIDVKNPKEGSLGANFPRVISDIKKAINGKAPLSAAIGDMDFKPGTASLAALGATVAGVDYVKIGLFGVRTKDEARELLEEVVHAVKDYREETYVVAAAYADYERVGAVSPYELPAIGKDVGLDVVMVDTGIKDGKTCFDFMGVDGLTEFVELSHDAGLQCALAGSITFENIPLLKRMSPDIVGVRGVVCGGDRNNNIKQELVERFRHELID